jgi:hypothetical protein
MLRALLTVILVLLAASRLPADYLEEQQKESRDRAAYWAERGFHFNPDTMNAYMMNQKVEDIERAKFWAANGYTFNPDTMNAYMMNQKVEDIERAKFWAAKGYSFDPNIMNAYMMNQKVEDIERAKFWAAKGYRFDPNIMNAYMMNQKVEDIERAKYWAAKGYNFDPNIMNSYMMDMEAAKSAPATPPQVPSVDIPVAHPVVAHYAPPRALPVAVSSAEAPAVMNLEPTSPVIPPALPVVQDASSDATGGSPPPTNFTAGLLQPIAKPVDEPKAHAPTAKANTAQ